LWADWVRCRLSLAGSDLAQKLRVGLPGRAWGQLVGQGLGVESDLFLMSLLGLFGLLVGYRLGVLGLPSVGWVTSCGVIV